MPMDLKDYPANWRKISLARRVSAGWKCEWCGIAQGSTETKSGKPVVLTVAHTHLEGGDRHDKHNLNGLRALCQACHLAYDLQDHIAHARETRRLKIVAVQPALFEVSI